MKKRPGAPTSLAITEEHAPVEAQVEMSVILVTFYARITSGRKSRVPF